MKLRVVLIAFSLALAGGIPGLITAAAAPAAAATAAYTMTDLGNLGGGVSTGFGINASGEVAGRSYLNKVFFFKCGRHICHFTQNDPFSWSGGTMTDLGTFNAMSMSEANAVNSTGDVVGGSNSRAFLVHNKKMTDLGPGMATSINDFGEIVGNASSGSFLVSGGHRTTLAGFAPVGINNHHLLAGDIGVAPEVEHAAIWNNGTITDLGTLGGPGSVAYAINDADQVVGEASTSTGVAAFIWQNGKMTDLGVDPIPSGINNNGLIVGNFGCGASTVILTTGSVCQNLQSLIPANSGYTLSEARGINDKGQIVAEASLQSDPNHPRHSVLLTPN